MPNELLELVMEEMPEAFSRSGGTAVDKMRAFVKFYQELAADMQRATAELPDSLNRPLDQRIKLLMERANREAKLAVELRNQLEGAASPAERPQSPNVMGIEGVNWGKDTAKYFPSAASGSKPGPRCPTKDQLQGFYREFWSEADAKDDQWNGDNMVDFFVEAFAAFFTPSAGEPQPHGKEKT